MAEPTTPDVKAARAKSEREALLSKLSDTAVRLDYPDPLGAKQPATRPGARVTPEMEAAWSKKLTAALEQS